MNTSIQKRPAGIQHQEKTCLVLANGPSLKGFDFKSDFESYDTIGMNAAYRYWHQTGWYPTYYSCLDEVVGLSHLNEISTLIQNSNKNGIKYFLLRNNIISKLKDQIPIDKVWNFDLLKLQYSILNSSPLTTGSHTCAWAIIMGYKKINLLGIDCNYVEIVEGAKVQDDNTLMIEAEKSNPNYFFYRYQQKGDVYNKPNQSGNLHIRAWQNLKKNIGSIVSRY